MAVPKLRRYSPDTFVKARSSSREASCQAEPRSGQNYPFFFSMKNLSCGIKRLLRLWSVLSCILYAGEDVTMSSST